MKIVRFQYGEEISFGILRDREVQMISGPPTHPLHLDRMFPLADVELLAPIVPTKIIAVALNYRKHAEEMGMTAPEEPLIFLKPPSALIGPEESIHLPMLSRCVEFEGELAAIIGRRCKNLSEAEVPAAVLGYSCFNDVTARDASAKGLDPLILLGPRAKGFDTFACLGPWIETEIQPGDLQLETRLNGIVRQNARSSNMIFSVTRLVSYISQIMTLEPGDIISTGTPAGSSALQVGDQVEVEIEGIGILRNPVH